MRLALHMTFAASRKEPLADLLERVHGAIVAAGLPEPPVQFVFADGPFARVSSVDRVIKRFANLERFVGEPVLPDGGSAGRVISNRPPPGATWERGEAAAFSILAQVARGVPRSFPFHDIRVHFPLSAFLCGAEPTPGGLDPGITVGDSWWVNGRQRALTALAIVEAEASARKLPALPDPAAAVLAALGKPKKTIQVPLPIAAPARSSPDGAAQATAQAIATVVSEYRARMGEVIERAGLPHDLPANREAAETAPRGVAAGPKKPALEEAFAPMGYDCRGESGTFTLRRRTSGNLTVEIYLDVGTWSNLVIAFLRVQGMAQGVAFKANLVLPVSRRAIAGGQYPMGGPENWRRIVANLAALVAELDRGFVPAVEAAAGPSPAWFRPETAAAKAV